jgi:Domain of unknown function (DUF4936)
MAASFYIYYRVADGMHAQALERVGALQRRLRMDAGAQCRLLRKRGEDNLWMEVYDRLPDEAAFQAVLGAAVNELALDEVVMPGSTRRIECFED